MSEINNDDDDDDDDDDDNDFHFALSQRGAYKQQLSRRTRRDSDS